MFFKPASLSIRELASLCGADLVNAGGLEEVLVNSASPIETASEGSVSFIDNPKYLKFLTTTKASAVFCAEKYVDQLPDGIAGLVHSAPYKAYGLALTHLYPTAMRPQSILGEGGISDKAILGKNTSIEDNVTIEAGAIIGANVAIGTGTVILAGATIGSGVQIGRNTTIGANVTIVNAYIGDNVIIHNGVQIGQDGFGFAMGAGGHHKVPQIGRVIIQDKVEIGANSTVDRGANRDTTIGEGTKIDNLVQIGHNATIGRHCVIVGLAGISGSATLGDYVVVAGQAGIVGHTKIGDGAQVGGGSGVHGDVAPGEKVMGYPAVSASKWMREAAKIMLADKRDRKNKQKG